MNRQNVPLNTFLRSGGDLASYQNGEPSLEFLKFRASKVSEIKPDDFFTPETIQLCRHEIPYLERDSIDQQLVTALEKKAHVILSGNTGVGKSRAVYEALRSFGDKYTVLLPVIVEEKHSSSFFDLGHVVELANASPQNQYCVCLDHIDKLRDFQGLFHELKAISHISNLTIILCGKEKHLQSFPFLMDVLPNTDRFKHIIIPDLSGEEREAFLGAYSEVVGEPADSRHKFGRTIAALLSRQSIFADYYRTVSQRSPEQQILWGIKSLYNLTRDLSFPRESVIKFTTSLSGIEVEDSAVKKDLEEAIDRLCEHNFLFPVPHDGSIFVSRDILPIIAKGYLLHVINNNNISVKTKQDEQEIYLAEELFDRMSAVFPMISTDIGNHLIRCLGSRRQTRAFIYQSLSKRIRIDLDTYNALIRKSKDKEEADHWDAKRAEDGLQPTLETLLAFTSVLKTYEELTEKERSLNISGSTESLIWCQALLGSVRNADQAIAVIQHFVEPVLESLPAEYYKALIERLNNFVEAYKVFELLPAGLCRKLDPKFYKSLLQLDGGDSHFQQAFQLFERLQKIDIEQTDSEILHALARRVKQIDQAELVLKELYRLPAEEVEEDILTLLLNKYKSSLSGQPWFRKQIINQTDGQQTNHQILALRDVEIQDRSRIFEKMVASGKANAKTYQLYLDHSSIGFSNAVRLYHRMIESDIFPSFHIFDILFRKYLASGEAYEDHEADLWLLYEHIREAIDLESVEGFAKLFLLLNQAFADFDTKVELFELAAAAKLDLVHYITLLIQAAKNYIDATKVLGVLYEVEAIPELDMCLRLFRIFLKQGVTESHRLEVMLFFKDLKNCGVENEILSRVYISLVDLPGSKIEPDTFLRDLSDIGIEPSHEVLVEIIFLQFDQKYVSAEAFRLHIEEHFDEGMITEKVIEDLILRCSNFQSAHTIYRVVNQEHKKVSPVSFKKMLDFAVHEREPEYVRLVLEEAMAKDVDYLVPLLSKLENRKNYRSLVDSFINSAELDPDEFRTIQNRQYWSTALAKAQQHIEKKDFQREELFLQLDRTPTLEDGILACINYINQGFDRDDKLMIRKLMEKASFSEMGKVLELCKRFNLDYMDGELVSNFILTIDEELDRRSIFEQYKKKVLREATDHEEVYKRLIYPFFSLLSVSSEYAYPADILEELTKLHQDINPVILERFADLIQKPEDAERFIVLADKYKIAISDLVLDRLILARDQSKVWDLMELYKGEIQKTKSKIYKSLVNIRNKEKHIGYFKQLFLNNKSGDKYPVISKLMLSALPELPDSIFAVYSAEGISLDVVIDVLEIFEKLGRAFPFSVIEQKINNPKKYSRSTRLRKYQSLMPLVQREETLSKLVTALVNENGLNSNTLVKVMKQKSSFVEQLSFFRQLRSYFHWGSLSITDDAILVLIDSMQNLEDYEAFREELIEPIEGKAQLPLSDAVSERLALKSISLLYSKRG